MSEILVTHRHRELRSLCSTNPAGWSPQQVARWLNVIGLEQYVAVFAGRQIDGFTALNLNEAVLEKELQIASKLHRKKLIKALDELRQFGRLPTTKSASPASFDSELSGSQTLIIPVDQALAMENYGRAKKPVEKCDDFPRILSVDAPKKLDLKLTHKLVKIGNDAGNHIAIADESVSRHHAEIRFDGGEFAIADVGSATGTFVRISDRLDLRPGVIFEIGSYQFLVLDVFIKEEVDFDSEESHVVIAMHESPQFVPEKLVLHNGSSIGRRANNTLSFPSDQHMSNLHCKFSLIGSRFVLEDMASTNGCWLRLSAEGRKSEPFPLRRDTEFKIANSAKYKILFSKKTLKQFSSTQSGQDGERPTGRKSHRDFCSSDGMVFDTEAESTAKCAVCWEAEPDCLLIPCSHNISCVKCAKSVKVCPVCREPIQDLMKIYREESF